MLFAYMEFFVRVVMVAGFAIPHGMAPPLTAYPSARCDHHPCGVTQIIIEAPQ